MNNDNGTLDEMEVHPGAHIAMRYLKEYLLTHDLFHLREAIASCALSGNRLATIATETLRRFLEKEPISDRYLMGLAWLLYSMNENGTDK